MADQTEWTGNREKLAGVWNGDMAKLGSFMLFICNGNKRVGQDGKKHFFSFVNETSLLIRKIIFSYIDLRLG